MVAITAFVLAAMLFSVHSAPVDDDSTSSAASAMHLRVKGSEDATSYHLTPFMDEIEDIDEEVSLELESVLPYINFLFDTLLNRSKQGQSDECTDDMTIQLVPEQNISSSDDDIPTQPETKDVDPDSKSSDADAPPA